MWKVNKQTPLIWIALMSKGLYNRENFIKKCQIVILRENVFEFIWGLRKKQISWSWWERFQTFSLEPKSPACFLDKFKSRTRWLRFLCFNKWGSDKEQLALNVGSQSTLSSSYCPRSSLESKPSSLNVRSSDGFGTGNSSLRGTSLIAVGKSLYFTVCLYLKVIPFMFVKQK